LKSFGHDVIAVGRRLGEIDGVKIEKEFPADEANVGTVSVYLNSGNQKEYYQRILDLKPQRVVFNPGAENSELEEMLLKNGIEPIEACTLVMLSTGQY
jgi:predicted CoA-binding protein